MKVKLSLLVVLISCVVPVRAQVTVVTAGGPSNDNAYDLFVESGGNVVVVGARASQPITFGEPGNEITLQNTASHEGFIAKYDPNGNIIEIIEAQKIGGAGLDGIVCHRPRCIQQRSHRRQQGGERTERLDVRGLSAGVYAVGVVGDGSRTFQTVVIR